MRFWKPRERNETPGPLGDKLTVTIGTDDYEPGWPFVCQAGTDGDLTYRTVDGATDQTETLTAGDSIQVAGLPVALRAVRGTSTITSIVVGVP